MPWRRQGGIGGQQVPQGLGALPPGTGALPRPPAGRRRPPPHAPPSRAAPPAAGKQQRLPAVFHPALGGCVKYAQESISSSKNSQRTGCSMPGENTSRMPPAGQTVRALHLVTAGISGSGQPPGQGVQVPLLAHGQGHCRPLQHPGQDAPLHQRVRGSDHHGAVRQAVQSRQPLVFPLAAGLHRPPLSSGPGAPGRLPGEHGQVTGLAPGLPFVGTQHPQGRPLSRCRAASTWARWTGPTPVTSTGETPPRTSSVSCRTSVRCSNSFTSAFTGHLPSFSPNGSGGVYGKYTPRSCNLT